MTSLCHNSGRVCVCVCKCEFGGFVCVYSCAIVQWHLNKWNQIGHAIMHTITSLIFERAASHSHKTYITRLYTHTDTHKPTHTDTHKKLSNFMLKKAPAKKEFPCSHIKMWLLFYACICLRLCPRCVVGT